MWVRGLKHQFAKGLLIDVVSHPMWVRGLKLTEMGAPDHLMEVAPHVGAWIETEPNQQT